MSEKTPLHMSPPHMSPNLADGLAALAGGQAEVWLYVSTHARLVIALTPKSGEVMKRKYLSLMLCTDIRLPTFWPIVRLSAASSKDGSELEITDNDVAVTCGGADLLDVDPTRDFVVRA